MISLYTTAVFLVLFLAHQQDILPSMAAVATVLAWVLLFFRKGLFSRSLLKPVPFWLGSVCLFYLFSNLLFNSADAFFSEPAAFIAKDGRLLYVLGFALLFALLSCNDLDAKCLLKACFLAGIISSAVSLLLIARDWNIYVLERRLGFADSGIPVGFLGEKNPFAGSLGSALIAGTLLLIHENRRGRMFLQLFGVTIILLTMAWTGSRGYFLAAILMASLVCYYEKRRQKKNWGFLALGLASLLSGLLFFINRSWDRLYLAFQGSDKNIGERVLLWKHYLSLWKDSMLTGLGPGSGSMPDLQVQSLIPYVLGRRISGTRFDGVFWEGGLPLGQHSHNIIVQCLLEFGIVGLLLLGFFLYYGLKACVLSLPPKVGCFAVYLFLYLFVSGMVDGLTLASPSISLPFFTMLALGMSQASSRKKHPA